MLWYLIKISEWASLGLFPLVFSARSPLSMRTGQDFPRFSSRSPSFHADLTLSANQSNSRPLIFITEKLNYDGLQN